MLLKFRCVSTTFQGQYSRAPIPSRRLESVWSASVYVSRASWYVGDERLSCPSSSVDRELCKSSESINCVSFHKGKRTCERLIPEQPLTFTVFFNRKHYWQTSRIYAATESSRKRRQILRTGGIGAVLLTSNKLLSVWVK